MTVIQTSGSSVWIWSIRRNKTQLKVHTYSLHFPRFALSGPHVWHLCSKTTCLSGIDSPNFPAICFTNDHHLLCCSTKHIFNNKEWSCCSGQTSSALSFRIQLQAALYSKSSSFLIGQYQPVLDSINLIISQLLSNAPLSRFHNMINFFLC